MRPVTGWTSPRAVPLPVTCRGTGIGMSAMSPVKTLPGWLRIRSIITGCAPTTATARAQILTSSRQRPKTADNVKRRSGNASPVLIQQKRRPSGMNGMSRQRQYQLRHKSAGLCLCCSRPVAHGTLFCELHRRKRNLVNRERQRKRFKRKIRYHKAESYKFRRSKAYEHESVYIFRSAMLASEFSRQAYRN